MRAGAALIAVLGLLAWNGAASAHSRGTSYSDWVIAKDGAQVTLRVSTLELTRLELDPAQTPDYTQRVAARLPQDLQLWSRSGICAPGKASVDTQTEGWLTARWAVRCPDADGYVIRSNLFLAVAPAHLHFARIESAGAPAVERVLTYAQPAFAIAEPADLPDSLGRYIRLGVEHILSGWDHMAFVLALILLAASIREVALLATGFTIAHSLTIAASVLGWVQVRPEAVEALIGFSIALVAIENLWLRGGRQDWLTWMLPALLLGLAVSGLTQMSVALGGMALFSACYFAFIKTSSQPLRLRIALAFIFGLVHGFGFAGVMTQMALPAERLAIGLLGFNTGVELGQLLVIGSVWPLLKLLERAPAWRSWTGDAASAAICALGTFWFLTRALV